MGMDSSSHQLQEMDSQTLESMLACSKPQQDKKPRPAEQALNCPRCDSNNTKFCYYNNYSLSQPRYFCKSCRRYWTKGGTLRNVPVGGGCRRNKRSSSSSCSSSSSKRSSQDQPLTPIPSPIPSLAHVAYDSNDLSLAFARLQKQSSTQLGLDDHEFSIMGNHPNMHNYDVIGNSGLDPSGGLFDALRGGFLETPFGINNLYYGNLGMECNGSMGISGSQEMGIGLEEFRGAINTSTPITAIVKQEMCNAKEGEEGRILWGFPWQSITGDGNFCEVDSNKLSWNGIGSTNLHGLLNSPLM